MHQEFPMQLVKLTFVFRRYVEYWIHRVLGVAAELGPRQRASPRPLVRHPRLNSRSIVPLQSEQKKKNDEKKKKKNKRPLASGDTSEASHRDMGVPPDC